MVGCLSIVIIVLAFFYAVGVLTQKSAAKSPTPAPAAEPLPTKSDAEKARQDAAKSLELGRKSLDAAVSKDLRSAAAEQGRKMLAEQLRATLDVTVTVRGVHSDRITLEAPHLDARWTEEFRKGGEVEALRNAGFRRVEVKGGKGYRTRFELEGMPAPATQLN